MPTESPSVTHTHKFSLFIPMKHASLCFCYVFPCSNLFTRQMLHILAHCRLEAGTSHSPPLQKLSLVGSDSLSRASRVKKEPQGEVVSITKPIP